MTKLSNTQRHLIDGYLREHPSYKSALEMPIRFWHFLSYYFSVEATQIDCCLIDSTVAYVREKVGV